MLSVEGVLSEMASNSTDDPSSFLSAFAEAVRKATGADVSQCKEFSGSGDKHTQGEEFILNTGMPYLDNSLSSYSAFPDLINYFNSGFRSCIMLPIKTKGRSIGMITLLSRKDRFFQEGDLRRVGLLGSLAAHEYGLLDEAAERARLSGYFNAAFNGIMPQCIIDRQGTVLAVNDAFGAIGGPAAAQRAQFAKIAGLDKSSFEKLRDGAVVDASLDGRKFRLYPKEAGDNALGIMFYDVTEMALLMEREQSFAYGTNDAYALLDSDTLVMWASSNVKDVLHIDLEYLLGKKLSSIVKDKDSLSELLARSERSPGTGSLEIMLGNGISVQASSTLVRNTGGYLAVLSKNTTGYIASLRKGIDDILRLSGDMVIMLDTLGYIKSANRSAEKLLRQKSDDLSGMAISSICADTDSQMRISTALNMAKKDSAISDIFANLLVKNGGTLPSQQGVRAVHDDSGKLSGYMLIGRELATKRAMENYQEAYERSKAESDKYKEESLLKTQFISSMAHDLRTPITSISGFAKLMLEGQPFGELNEKQKESLQTIVDESERLNELIEHILDAAKLESKKVKLDLRMVDMRELGQNAGIKSLAEVASNKGLSFNYEVDYDVPAIACDPNRVVQVLVNLIGNAIKFTEKGGITIHVRRNGKGKKVKRVRIEVKDTGIGVSREDKSKLFRKFFQIEKNDLVMKAGKGTGLGLTIVKEIVGLHDGTAGVESELGKGSTFWFTLPISQKKENKGE